MNKRIKKLAEQAGIYKLNLSDETEYWIMEKFAQLLIKECADFIDSHKRVDEYGLACDIVYGVDLMKHFGVEEQEKVAPKPKCSVCGTTENVKYMGGYQPYLCDSIDCIPF